MVSRRSSLYERAQSILSNKVVNPNKLWADVIAKKSLVELMNTRQFLSIYVMNFFSIFLGIFVIGSQKDWGKSIFESEKFLSSVASLGGVFAAFRFIWSFLVDKYSYKLIYSILLILQMIIGVCLPLVLESNQSEDVKQIFFFSFVMLAFFCEGGHFVLGPTICGKLFGAEGGVRVFSVAFSFCGIGSLVHILLEKLIGEKAGFNGFAYMYAGFSFISLLIL